MEKNEKPLEEVVNSLNLDMSINEEEYEESEKESETDEKKHHKCHVPTIKINCDLEVNVGNENKIIYVCPGRIQYFTASAIHCCGDKSIEIEFCGCNTKCICGETFICGRLGYYKLVTSGIIFIPKRKLSEFPDLCYPTDILHFRAKSKCDKDVDFVVVFTFSRCVNCGCHSVR